MDAAPEPLVLARERYAARDYHGVVLILEDAARTAPLFPDAANLLGLALAMIGRDLDALDAFDHALERNPRDVEALLNRGVLALRLGREEEARENFAHAEEFGAADATGFPTVVANKLANSHAALGDDYRAAGALDRAVAQYRAALELRPAFADIRMRLGRALLEAGDLSGAGEALAAALAVRPGLLDAMLLRGLVYYLQGQLTAAAAVWDEASRRHPEEPRLEIYRSMLARRQEGRSTGQD